MAASIGDDEDFSVGEEQPAEPAHSVGAELLTGMLCDAGILRAVHSAGIHPRLLDDSAVEEAFQDLLTHFATKNEPMTLARFQKRHPNIQLTSEYRPEVQDLLLDVILAAKQRHIAKFRLDLDSLLDPDVGGNFNREENLEKIYDGARALLQQHAAWFTTVTDRVQTFGVGDDIMQRYEDLKNGVVPGIRVPGDMFKDIMEDIRCLGYGHMTGLFARPGVKKTWVLVLLACLVADSGRNTFIWSSEMEPAELKERSVAMLARLNFTRFTKAALIPDEYDRLQKFFKSKLAENLNKHLFIAGPTALSTVEDLEIYCADNRVELVCLDNVHTMESRGEEHVKIANLMFDLKYMAIRRRAALVYTTHQNRYGGSSMEGVAYGDAFNTWSSNMINLKRVDDRKVQATTVKVRSGVGNQNYHWVIDLDRSEFKSMRLTPVRGDGSTGPRQQQALDTGGSL